MVLIEIRQSIIHKHIALKRLFQCEVNDTNTRCHIRRQTFIAGAGRFCSSVINLDLTDVVGGDEDADADGNEDEADDEEGGQHRAGGEDGLPGRQPLLFEGRVIRPPGLGGAPRRTRGPAVHLILRAIVHRHWPPGFGSAPSSWAAQRTCLPILTGDTQSPLPLLPPPPAPPPGRRKRRDTLLRTAADRKRESSGDAPGREREEIGRRLRDEGRGGGGGWKGEGKGGRTLIICPVTTK